MDRWEYVEDGEYYVLKFFGLELEVCSVENYTRHTLWIHNVDDEEVEIPLETKDFSKLHDEAIKKTMFWIHDTINKNEAENLHLNEVFLELAAL